MSCCQKSHCLLFLCTFTSKNTADLAEPGDTREHELAAAGVLQRVLAEKEIDVVVDVERTDELGICSHSIA